ncbi:MAG TPA: serine/threonine-protein kinase [Waterburya sp.]|jgi:serine/threonine-protein kinase
MNLTAETAFNHGKYIFHNQLGKGVFGITYRATNTESGQTVVVKTLSENLRQHSDFEQFKRQFLELGERLKHCKHPHLVPVLDVFEEAGCPYLVMEYIPGATLGELIQAEVLSQAQALDYIRQVGEALRALHKAGLLHRDVKPQNIIRRQNTERVVLGELGMTGEFSAGMMQTQASLLSAGYAPLEQYSLEEPRTPATDVYGLAASLYYLLYRTPPLPAPVRQALLANGKAHLFFPKSGQITPNIGLAVKQAIWRGLEITAQKRPQTVDAWLSLLTKPEKKPTPRPSLRECLVVQSTAKQTVSPPPDSLKKTVKAAATSHKPSPPAPLEKNVTPYPSRIQPWVAKLPIPDKLGNIASTPLTTLKGLILQLFPASEEKAKTRQSLLKALLMTGAIAASAGVGFGVAVRVNRPSEPGSTFFHTEQSFPPRSDWPGSERRL